MPDVVPDYVKKSYIEGQRTTPRLHVLSVGKDETILTWGSSDTAYEGNEVMVWYNECDIYPWRIYGEKGEESECHQYGSGRKRQ